MKKIKITITFKRSVEEILPQIYKVLTEHAIAYPRKNYYLKINLNDIYPFEIVATDLIEELRTQLLSIIYEKLDTLELNTKLIQKVVIEVTQKRNEDVTEITLIRDIRES